MLRGAIKRRSLEGLKTYFAVNVWGFVEVFETCVRQHWRACQRHWTAKIYSAIPHQPILMISTRQPDMFIYCKLSPIQKTMSLFLPFSVTNNYYDMIYSKLHCVCLPVQYADSADFGTILIFQLNCSMNVWEIMCSVQINSFHFLSVIIASG